MPLTQVSSRLIEDTLRYVLGASGTNHYTFTGKGLTGAVNDPTLTLSRGHTYVFENRNSSGSHPFYIKTSIANGGTNDAYNTGVTNNGGAGGTEIVFTVPHDAPDLLYYQCSSHSSMAGELKIAGAVADGSITTAKLADTAVTEAKLGNFSVTANKLGANAVTTDKIPNNAVTNAKIVNDAVTSDKIADQAVTLAKLEHGTSSNDGKFLRANNGADPSFETITVPVGIPSGGIILWSGAANAIPSGFVLCDGNNSTPNLQDRFVVGAGNSYSVGDTGGSATHTLTAAEMPSHNHSFSGSNSHSHNYSLVDKDSAGIASGQYQRGVNLSNTATSTATITISGTTSSNGSGNAHNNLPPYYALCYIMKT